MLAGLGKPRSGGRHLCGAFNETELGLEDVREQGDPDLANNELIRKANLETERWLEQFA